jgi:hypothetical protein
MTIDPERAEIASGDPAGGVVERLSEGREADRLLAKAELSTKGGIVAALLGSPLVGSDLDLRRDYDAGRMVDL